MKTDEVLSADGLLEVAVIFHTPAHEALSLGRSSAKVKQVGVYESNESIDMGYPGYIVYTMDI